MNKAQAIHAFWSGFGLPAYDQYTVPKDAQMPYITYSLSYDAFGNEVSMNGSIWYHTTSWTNITQKADLISENIGLEGKIIKTDNGYLWIKRGSPFYQRLSEEDNIKRIYINIICEYFQKY